MLRSVFTRKTYQSLYSTLLVNTFYTEPIQWKILEYLSMPVYYSPIILNIFTCLPPGPTLGFIRKATKNLNGLYRNRSVAYSELLELHTVQSLQHPPTAIFCWVITIKTDSVSFRYITNRCSAYYTIHMYTYVILIH